MVIGSIRGVPPSISFPCRLYFPTTPFFNNTFPLILPKLFLASSCLIYQVASFWNINAYFFHPGNSDKFLVIYKYPEFIAVLLFRLSERHKTKERHSGLLINMANREGTQNKFIKWPRRREFVNVTCRVFAPVSGSFFPNFRIAKMWYVRNIFYRASVRLHWVPQGLSLEVRTHGYRKQKSQLPGNRHNGVYFFNSLLWWKVSTPLNLVLSLSYVFWLRRAKFEKRKKKIIFLIHDNKSWKLDFCFTVHHQLGKVI